MQIEAMTQTPEQIAAATQRMAATLGCRFAAKLDARPALIAWLNARQAQGQTNDADVERVTRCLAPHQRAGAPAGSSDMLRNHTWKRTAICPHCGWTGKRTRWNINSPCPRCGTECREKPDT